MTASAAKQSSETWFHNCVIGVCNVVFVLTVPISGLLPMLDLSGGGVVVRCMGGHTDGREAATLALQFLYSRTRLLKTDRFAMFMSFKLYKLDLWRSKVITFARYNTKCKSKFLRLLLLTDV